MVDVTLVGSGTLVPHRSRRSPATWIELGALRVLVDCGPGTIHRLAELGLPWRKVTHVVVTHFHNDHVSDLAALLFAYRYGQDPPRSEPLTLLGPRGLEGLLDRLADAFGAGVRTPGFPLHVIEVEPGAGRSLGPDLSLTVFPTPHTDESVALRFETPAGHVGFTGDTGPSEAVGGFLAGCALLVSECSYADPPPNDVHLSPASVARLARIAEPGLLILTHVFPPAEPTDAAKAVGVAGYGGRVLAGYDGMRIRLAEGAEPSLETPSG